MQNKLISLTQVLLNPSSDRTTLEKKLSDLARLFEMHSVVKIEPAPSEHKETLLEHGVALSPEGAARCLLEPYRTSHFLQGIHQAIKDHLSKFSHPIHILYAGTGPFGSLLIPLLPLFNHKKIQVTLLDYHEESLESVKRIVKAFHLENYIKSYTQADATIYQHPKNDPIHIIISETMTAGLEKEMQVPITLNLAPQLIDNGCFIPEEITVNALLINPENAFIQIGKNANWKETIDLGTVFRLNKSLACDFLHLKQQQSIPANEVCFPKQIKDGMQPFLSTEIIIYKTTKLSGYQSTLNHLIGFPAVDGKLAGRHIRLSYDLQKPLGLRAY